ncbi:hypothetical protein MNBD_GAMMA09-2531 [hydrothermal vent metagenome]|uniref:Uncharacterized protein n=1 Tax=hydrothermal vent metagenome TaxID=652676 RepID=A0A3B0XMQ8_9ZZZZ
MLEKILEKYQFRKSDLTDIFTKLDRLGIIDLLAGNRYRLKVSQRFSWLKNGLIQHFFRINTTVIYAG